MKKKRIEIGKVSPAEVRLTIPEKIQLGGVEIGVEIFDDITPMGRFCADQSLIMLSSNQTKSSLLNTFCHELVHAILFTMGKGDLNNDESFVSSFASFLTEAIVSSKRNNKNVICK